MSEKQHQFVKWVINKIDAVSVKWWDLAFLNHVTNLLLKALKEKQDNFLIMWTFFCWIANFYAKIYKMQKTAPICEMHAFPISFSSSKKKSKRTSLLCEILFV